ncbi:MAG: helix-turn-helix domain-containing protein [Gammaproteobacteria bacterium]
MHGETRVLYGDFGRAAALWPGNNLVPHAHRDAHIVLAVGDSQAIASVGATNIVMERGTAVAINPFEIHSFQLIHPTDRPVLVTFYVSPQWLQRRHGLASFAPFAQPQFSVDEAVQATARAFVDAIERGAALDDLLAKEIELFLDALIVRSHHAVLLTAAALNVQRSDFRVRRAMTFMQENLESRTTLESVARHVGLSRPHFFSLFHEQTRMTPKIYWNLLRIETAMGQMGSARTPLSTVAFNLGFSSQGNFSRFFREHVGVSPLCYRRATL